MLVNVLSDLVLQLVSIASIFIILNVQKANLYIFVA